MSTYSYNSEIYLKLMRGVESFHHKPNQITSNSKKLLCSKVMESLYLKANRCKNFLTQIS